MTSAVDQSIEQIETKIAFLERAVGELSDVVVRQQREIQTLKAQIEQLRDRLEAAQAQEAPTDPALERPPHY
jgi:SlyX protein